MITIHKCAADAHFNLAELIFSLNENVTSQDYANVGCEIENCTDCYGRKHIKNFKHNKNVSALSSCSDSWVGGCEIGDPDCKSFKSWLGDPNEASGCQEEDRFYYQEESEICDKHVLEFTQKKVERELEWLK